jgi:hypothetical protein
LNRTEKPEIDMCCARRGAPPRSLKLSLVLFAAAVALPGCNRGSGPSDEQRVDQFLKESKIVKVPVAKMAGHVSVDNQPPSREGRLFVILNDPEHPVPTGKAAASCDAEGNFSFTTYLKDDGVPVGKYVVTFALLHHNRGGGRGGGVGRRPGIHQEFIGPDDLKNLYSDPEKNKDVPTYIIDVTEPGRTDYDFQLPVAGKDPVPTPGKFAFRKIMGM